MALSTSTFTTKKSMLLSHEMVGVGDLLIGRIEDAVQGDIG
jgi:hypothetical protein